MKMSETIADLATALSKAQGQIEAATKGSVNPAFRSKYADINALRDAIREPLAVNDLSLLQFPRTLEGRVEVETMILHKSGEYMSETLSMPVSKQDAHGIGSALTYARRYGMSAMLNLAADDDDGNGAVEKAPAKVDPAAVKALALRAKNEAEKGMDALSAFWKGLNETDRKLLTPDLLKDLKEIATAIDKKETE
jgi:hypothetical protein